MTKSTTLVSGIGRRGGVHELQQLALGLGARERRKMGVPDAYSPRWTLCSRLRRVPAQPGGNRVEGQPGGNRVRGRPGNIAPRVSPAASTCARLTTPAAVRRSTRPADRLPQPTPRCRAGAVRPVDRHYHHQPTEPHRRGRVRSVLNASSHTAEDMEGDVRQEPSDGEADRAGVPAVGARPGGVRRSRVARRLRPDDRTAALPASHRSFAGFAEGSLLWHILYYNPGLSLPE